MYARYAAALSAADAAAQADDTTCLARLQAAAAAAPVLRPSRLAAAVRARAVGAVVGAACADGASMPTHWVYDMTKLAAMVAGRDAAFLEPPADAFYKYPVGSASPYGQQAATLLYSLVESGGFSPEAYAARNFATFGAPEFVAAGGYLDGSSKGFLRAVRAGAGWPGCGVPDDQANAVARLPPLVAAFAGDERLLPAVERMVRVTQDSDVAAAWGMAAARVLEAVILGAAPADAVGVALSQLRDPARVHPGALDAHVADAMEVAVSLAGVPHADAVSQLGRNCHLPGSAQSPMHALIAQRLETGAAAYQAAVMDTILQARAACVRLSQAYLLTLLVVPACSRHAATAGRVQRLARWICGRLLRRRARRRCGAFRVAHKVHVVQPDAGARKRVAGAARIAPSAQHARVQHMIASISAAPRCPWRLTPLRRIWLHVCRPRRRATRLRVRLCCTSAACSRPLWSRSCVRSLLLHARRLLSGAKRAQTRHRVRRGAGGAAACAQPAHAPAEACRGRLRGSRAQTREGRPGKRPRGSRTSREATGERARRRSVRRRLRRRTQTNGASVRRGHAPRGPADQGFAPASCFSAAPSSLALASPSAASSVSLARLSGSRSRKELRYSVHVARQICRPASSARRDAAGWPSKLARQRRTSKCCRSVIWRISFRFLATSGASGRDDGSTISGKSYRT